MFSHAWKTADKSFYPLAVMPPAAPMLRQIVHYAVSDTEGSF